jgi:deoxyribodipyrimidine photo-lyase
MQKINIVWLRRDLRLEDNVALFNALGSKNPVLPLFIFDKNILDKLEDKTDLRVQFLHNTLTDLQKELQKIGTSLEVHYGTPIDIFNTLTKKYKIEEVFANHDYEAYGINRDIEIKAYLESSNIVFSTYKDHVIFEKHEVTKDDGLPYTVFTPYSKKWKLALAEKPNIVLDCKTNEQNYLKQKAAPIISLQSMGFNTCDFNFPTKEANLDIIKNYSAQRDFPGIESTSKLGLHLRFGTISIRALCDLAKANNETFLNELIWRDFYNAILFHFPHVNKGQAFRPIYDNIEWNNNTTEFVAWCIGKTGYPIVDAGMRELNATGFMHNRVRMIVASFLVKHLLIDWRWGEAYFAKKLLDFDFASNNGGWQWASSSGCDAAPYFRVFNPTLQMDKFDKDRKYINKWIPELNGFGYPAPIVNHEFARKRVLEAYKKALAK